MAGRIKDREERYIYSASWIGGGERSEPSSECLSCHMTLKVNPVTLLASPLGEEGHKVAKGWTVVILIMILDVDVTVAGGLCHLGFLSLDMPAV